MNNRIQNRPLGWVPNEFSLKGTDGELYSLQNILGAKGLVVMFICNHCPYVIAIAERLSFEAKELKKSEINTIAIMSNDANQYPEDSFENMALFAKKYAFDFPYLHDKCQQIARNYGAVCTPDIFGFNSNLILQYRGRLDSGVMKSNNENIKRELFEAMSKIKSDGIGPLDQFNSIGCSIKWKENE